jgi:ribokinase
VSRARLYTLGNFTIDDIVRWPDGLTYMGQPGGDALYSALGARVWLERVGLLARLGRDYPSAQLAALEARGLCLGLVPVDAPTLHDWALYEADGNRQFINHVNSGSNEEMTLGPDEITPEHLGAEAYHLAPVPIHQQLALARHLRRPGARLSIDPHYTWIEGHTVEVGQLMALADFFLPSRLEARQIYGADAPEAAAVALAALGPGAVVIKLEAEGSIVYDAAGRRLAHVPIFPTEAPAMPTVEASWPAICSRKTRWPPPNMAPCLLLTSSRRSERSRRPSLSPRKPGPGWRTSRRRRAC